MFSLNRQLYRHPDLSVLPSLLSPTFRVDLSSTSVSVICPASSERAGNLAISWNPQITAIDDPLQLSVSDCIVMKFEILQK